MSIFAHESSLSCEEIECLFHSIIKNLLSFCNDNNVTMCLNA